MATIRSACPVVRQGPVEFCVWVQAGEGEVHPVSIERTVHWLQTSTSIARFVHGGEVLREEPMSTDGGGYLASVTDALAHVRESKLVEQYSINANSTLVLEVEVVVVERPVFALVASEPGTAQPVDGRYRTWGCIPDDWLVFSPTDGQYVPIQSVELWREVVWSTRHTDEVNALALESFLDRWKVIEVG